jgi:hypothetical protein
MGTTVRRDSLLAGSSRHRRKPGIPRYNIQSDFPTEQKMLSRSHKRVILFALMVYLLSVGFSVYLLDLKRASLQFHSRDYNYFIEQAAKLADPKLKDRFALNIEGSNFIGLIGSEGVVNIFQAIHIEYFRYLYPFLYWIFHSTWPIYVLYSMMFFFPVIYIAVLPRSTHHPSWVPVLMFILLYVLYPATFFSVVSDLRPRLLFPSAWILVTVSIYFDRPFLEKLLLFLFLISIREEGILLGAIIILLNFLRMHGKTGQWKQTLVFLSVDLLAIVFFLLFMRWGGYTRFDPTFSIHTILATLLSKRAIAGITGVTAALAGLLSLVWLRCRRMFLNVLLLLAYLSAILLTGIQAYREGMGWYAYQSSLSSLTVLDYVNHLAWTHMALVFYIIILLLVLLLDFFKGTKQILLQTGLGFLCVLFALMTLQVLPRAVMGWKSGVEPARLVWDFKSGVDPYSARVLVDYSTYQAFFDFQQIIVYERLPLWIAHPEEQYYPENKQLLAQLVKERIDYAVIGSGSLETVREFSEMAGIAAEEVEYNSRYVILRFRR